MKNTNSYATKLDLKKLKQYVDKRFNGVDKRFNAVDKRFDLIDRKFSWFRSEINDDLDLKFKDMMRLFEHKWQQKIDPILREIVHHREKEIIHWHQYDRIQKMFQKIAQKVGVEIDD
ncbi:hypothetical protein A3I57_03330 [Candidatus Beckwithbacteria bacterium RIFCSPLOWO2_02_FULL_47_23]|uniref:Uncharacterized protein n=1 Tax=Candidatus Beckwithbacteria bacterium RIFCSPLOWO2_02_FULL_47_23 TaxID=1797463 RepID=A0A1F5DWE4_9BACT|nr:MAG: hypothetical protein A3I57_03330 [Candidatus Beckwithbacteria bacterium RIFCSPLOWO2_02_FULL_47_23]